MGVAIVFIALLILSHRKAFVFSLYGVSFSLGDGFASIYIGNVVDPAYTRVLGNQTTGLWVCTHNRGHGDRWRLPAPLEHPTNKHVFPVPASFSWRDNVAFVCLIYPTALCLLVATYKYGKARGRAAMRHGSCAMCGYDLRSTLASSDDPTYCICPECGQKNRHFWGAASISAAVVDDETRKITSNANQS